MFVPLPEPLYQFVESSMWTFAKTYASTWPHDYIVQTPHNASMILALARHIFENGIEERFYSQTYRYHHEGGKVYWCMASTPQTTTLINRCEEGTDLRGAARGRHASRPVQRDDSGWTQHRGAWNQRRPPARGKARPA